MLPIPIRMELPEMRGRWKKRTKEEKVGKKKRSLIAVCFCFAVRCQLKTHCVVNMHPLFLGPDYMFQTLNTHTDVA